jgi:hypothetical protein
MADLVTRILLDNKQFNDNIEKSKKQVESFKNIQSNVIGTLGKFAGVIGIAGGAMATFDKLIHSSQTTADAWDKTIGSAKASVDSFFTSLSTGDFTSFFNGLEGIISRSNSAIEALDQLGNTKIAYNFRNTELNANIADARMAATNKDLSKTERDAALKVWEENLEIKAKNAQALQEDILDAVQKSVAKSNLLVSDSIDFNDIKKIINTDLEGKNRDFIKNYYGTQHKDYSNQIANLKGQKLELSERFKNSFGTFSKEDYQKELKAINDREKELTSSYKSAILYNELLVKYSDEELTKITEQISAYHNLSAEISNNQKEFNQTKYKVNNSDKTDKTTKTEEIISSGSIAELDKKLSDLRKQFLATSDSELRAQLSSEISWVESQKVKLTFEAKFPDFKESIQPQMAGLGNATKGTDISKIKLKPIITQQDVKLNNEYLDGLTAMGSVMGNLNNVFNNNTNSVLQWASTTISAVASIIPVIQTLTLAKKQEAVAAGIASAAETPLVGWLMVAGAAAAVLASFASIPQMADGGIVYKNSLVNVAEYGNASSNPEVIAPLNKLKSLLHNDNDTSNNGGEVKFKISGTELIGVLNNYNKRTSKVR